MNKCSYALCYSKFYSIFPVYLISKVPKKLYGVMLLKIVWIHSSVCLYVCHKMSQGTMDVVLVHILTQIQSIFIQIVNVINLHFQGQRLKSITYVIYLAKW